MNFKATGTIAGIDAATPSRALARRVVGDNNSHPRNIIKSRTVALTLTGQRSYTDERRAETQHTATSRSGGCWTCLRVMRNSGCRFVPRLFLLFRPCNLGNPCAEKVRPHRARQNNVSEPALVAGVGGHWQGTLTITGSNVRLGTELHTSAFVPDTEALISDSTEQSEICAQSLLARSKPSPARTWSQRWKRDSWTQHLSGRILKPSHGPSFVTAWTSSLAATRASRSAQPASDSEPKTHDTSGRLSQPELLQCDQCACFFENVEGHISPGASRRYARLGRTGLPSDVVRGERE
jgi:hypothetical protein